MLIKKCKNIIFEKTGECNVLTIKSEELQNIKDDEIIIDQKAIGINYIDIYHRTGLYELPLPSKIGLEAAGIIIEKGKNVSNLSVGDRVAYASMPLGSYCDYRIISAKSVCKVPNEISLNEAAGLMLKGLTVEYLFNRITKISAGENILFHAAAGGVGLLACQWAKSEGVNMIATAGTDDKCQLALQNGAKYAINYRKEKFEKRVMEITQNKGVNVVMDSVGKETFLSSLNCIRPLGMMISFGNSSGKIPPFDIQVLQSKGSLKITRPSLFNPFLMETKTYQDMTKNLFEKVTNKEIKINIGKTFKFEEVTKAHMELEDRKTFGSIVINL